MSQTDTFGAYVRTRLEGWGREFALHRDMEWLGYASKNQIQVLIEHKGDMPPPNVGYKPLEVDEDAYAIEKIVTEIARTNRAMAICLRAYYCGRGRRNVERWETANLLLTNAGERAVSVRAYQTMHQLGFERVRGLLEGIHLAAAA